MGRMPKFKPDEKGRPRYLPADYIMRKDPHARVAYHALRRRGRSPAEAEHAIELTSWHAFIEAVLHEKDRRPEIWFLLAEGLPVEKIFPKFDAEGRVVN
jgi:hypothetical protein